MISLSEPVPISKPPLHYHVADHVAPIALAGAAMRYSPPFEHG